MSNIKLDITKAACFLEAGAVKAFEPKVKAAQAKSCATTARP